MPIRNGILRQGYEWCLHLYISNHTCEINCFKQTLCVWCGQFKTPHDIFICGVSFLVEGTNWGVDFLFIMFQRQLPTAFPLMLPDPFFFFQIQVQLVQGSKESCYQTASEMIRKTRFQLLTLPESLP